MARRGEVARQSVVDTIVQAFGERFVTIQDKKIYVESQDGSGGEVIQFAISLTMPKNTVTREGSSSVETDWSGPTAAVPTPTKISDEDAAKVAQLMEQLGLS